MARGLLPDGGRRHADMGANPVEAVFAGHGFFVLLVVQFLLHVWGNFHCVIGHTRNATAHATRATGVAGANAVRGRERAF